LGGGSGGSGGGSGPSASSVDPADGSTGTFVGVVRDSKHGRTNGNSEKQSRHSDGLLGIVGDWVQREDNLRLNFGFAVIISGQLLSH
jgi:hypothetical protein